MVFIEPLLTWTVFQNDMSMPRSKDSTQQTFRYLNYFLVQNRKLFVKNVSGQNTCTMNLHLKLHFIKNKKKI